jgi:hypothetical protein
MELTKQNQLTEVLEKLAKKELQIKLLVGYQDSINGYGWHVKYYVEVIKCIEFCCKCRAKYNVDYFDNYYPLHHQHSHRTEYKIIFSKDFRNVDDLCFELSNI